MQQVRVNQCPACGGPLAITAASCPRCGHVQHVAQVQSVPGTGGRFLDPKANTRSCLGCVAAIVLAPFLMLLIGMLMKALGR